MSNCSGFRDTPISTTTELPPFEELNNNILHHLNIIVILSLSFIILNLLFVVYVSVELILRRIKIHRGHTLLIEEGNPPEYTI